MKKMKEREVIVCDVCGVDDDKAQIASWTFLSGLGYQPSNDDPLAQKFKKLYKTPDICDRCRNRMNHYFLSLSPEERDDIVLSGLMEKNISIDNSMPGPAEEKKWADWPNVIYPIMNGIQTEEKEDSDIVKAAKERFFPEVSNE